MNIKIASVKLRNARDNRARVCNMDINEAGAETGVFLTVATMDIIQAAVLLLREIVSQYYDEITSTDETISLMASKHSEKNTNKLINLSFSKLVEYVPDKYNGQLWLKYLKENTSRIEKWLETYQMGDTIKMFPGQYGILYDNIKDLYNTVEKDYYADKKETYDERIRYKLFELGIPYSVEDIKFYLSEKEVMDDEELTKQIIFAKTLLEQ